jgi:hypothetical protein
MEGMSSNFQGGNAAMLQMNNYGNIPTQPVPQQNNTSELTPQKKAVFERLKKRMSLYRKRQNETIPRFDQTFTGICEQQNVETNLLQKKFLESKAKRVAKKTDKKQTDVVGGNAMSKAQKRPAPDDLENDPDLHPPTKIPQQQQNQQNQNQQQQSQQSMDNMKFQVEIVQQLEFTTSSVNLQPQQISTNVTVKTTANGSMTTKYEPQEMKQKMNEPAKMQQMAPLPPPAPDLLQDFKQEPDNEFADLDFGGIANFMANDENELKKLFSNISEVFDASDLFDDTKHIKQEPMMKTHHQIPQMPQMMNQNLNPMATNQFNQYVMQDTIQMQKPIMQQMPQQPQPQQQQQPTQQMRMYQQQTMQQQMQPDITPAAQTLKNMAQQHQVKSSMAMNYMRPVGQQMGIPQQQMIPQQQAPQPPPQQQRLPYQQYNEYSQFAQQQQQPQHKPQMQLPFPPEMIKQEIMMQQQPPQMQHINTMKPMMNHQMIHEEPKIHQNYQNFQNQQFIQQQPQRTFQQQPQQNPMSIHMKQTQMMHIQQQGNPGGNMQMQGAQHMGMTMNDGNFSMQQQQNMYFSQHHTHQPNTHPQYANTMAAAMQQQKRQQQQQQQHHPQMMGEGPTHTTGTYNMMQNQSMSFTQ